MMTPPPWYLSLVDGKIRVYNNGELMRQEKGPDAGKEYGCVTSIEVAMAKAKGKIGELITYKIRGSS